MDISVATRQTDSDSWVALKAGLRVIVLSAFLGNARGTITNVRKMTLENALKC